MENVIGATMHTRREVCAAPAAFAISAVPTAAATKPAEGIDYDAIRERLGLVVETFSRATVGFPEPMHADEAAAILSLSDAEIDDADTLIPFAHKWGVCLDWLIVGDVKALIHDGRSLRERERGDRNDPAVLAFEEWQQTIICEEPAISRGAQMYADEPGAEEAFTAQYEAEGRVTAAEHRVVMQDAITPKGVMAQLLALCANEWGRRTNGNPRQIDGYQFDPGCMHSMTNARAVVTAYRSLARMCGDHEAEADANAAIARLETRTLEYGEGKS
ncbi:MAG: hypothetical protein AAFY66_01350 [Pseudomonadota bacterium]